MLGKTHLRRELTHKNLVVLLLLFHSYCLFIGKWPPEQAQTARRRPVSAGLLRHTGRGGRRRVGGVGGGLPLLEDVWRRSRQAKEDMPRSWVCSI